MTRLQKSEQAMAAIPWFDRVVMTLAFFALCTLAAIGLYRWIRAPYPLSYALAALGVTFLIYSLLMPFVRSK